MSGGAIFQLIANDGKADRMIVASKLLNQRIKDIMCARQRAGNADITPTLVDIERTHILYVNAHFKPFAAIGFEYNKAKPQTGNASLGGSVSFSIPQFGDFFHDMVARVRLSAVQAKQGKVPAVTTVPSTVSSSSPSTWPLKYVDAFGNTLTAGDAYRNFVRYCEFPGNRLQKMVKFDVNGNPLDQYDTVALMMLEKFCVAPNKRTGYNRLVGQEVPMTGYSGLCKGETAVPDFAKVPTSISKFSPGQSSQTVSLFKDGAKDTLQVDAKLGDADSYDISQRLHQFVNGPQTPKPIQPPLELWNKLRFWFNDDVRLSIPSVCIPFGQRYITIDFALQEDLVYEHPSIFAGVTVKQQSGSNYSYPTDVQLYVPYLQLNGIEQLNIEKVELYINNLFVNPEIHDIYIKRIGFSLIRVYRQHTRRVIHNSGDEEQLTQLKWPIEYMFVGFRPVWNTKGASNTDDTGAVTAGNENAWRDWHQLSHQVKATVHDELYNGELDIPKIIPDHYYLSVPTVDSLTLKSHGNVIYDGFNDTLFNQYLPFHYGGPSISTPEDVGALFVNLALFPRSYQPSGHLNVSRARETCLSWSSSYISADSPADMLVVAVAINFLLITDGSAVLRYST